MLPPPLAPREKFPRHESHKQAEIENNKIATMDKGIAWLNELPVYMLL
jgi:hypothetical protein